MVREILVESCSETDAGVPDATTPELPETEPAGATSAVEIPESGPDTSFMI